MLFIAGYHASGKSLISSFLTSHYNVLHIETSALVRAAHLQDQPNLPLGVWAEQMEEIHGSRVFDDLIADTVIAAIFSEIEEGRDYDEVAISGNRSYEGIQHITQRLQASDTPIPKEREILFVSATIETLYDRYRERNRESGDDCITMEEFTAITVAERATGIDEIYKNATLLLDNSKDVGHFYRQMIEVARQLDLPPRLKEREKMINV